MSHSYRSAVVSALCGVALVTAQGAQLAILRRMWWGWPAIGAGVILHSTVWAVVGASLLGVWMLRGSLIDGSSVLITTSSRSRSRLVLEQLWPCLAVVVVGQVLLGLAVAVLGRDGFGGVDWLLLAPGSFWIAAGLLWGTWCALYTPWKTCWLVAPGVPLVVFTLATKEAWGLRLLPILPNSDPFGQVTWERSAVLLVSAVAVLLLVAVVTLRFRHRRVLATLSVLVLAAAAGLPVREYVPALGADDVRCLDDQTPSICVPAAYRAIGDRLRRNLEAAAREHPALLTGAVGFTAAPGPVEPAVVQVHPEAGWQGVSMLATDADLRLALAVGLASSERCVPTELQPILLLHTADRLGASAASQYPQAKRTVELFTADDPLLRSVDDKVRAMTDGELGGFLAARRVDPDACALSPQQFLGQ